MSKKLKLHYIGCTSPRSLLARAFCPPAPRSDILVPLVDLDKWDEHVKPDSARIAGTCDFIESPAPSESSDESAGYSDSESD